MAPDNSAPKSNNGDDNNANSTSAAATATAPSKLLVPRPPLNPYRKIAIVRDPATDVVICEDVERPGKFKKVIVGELMDPSKEKKNVSDEQKVVESGTDRSTNKESEVKTNDEKNEEKKPEASESNNQNRSGSGGKGKPKTEIPVPTITVVKSYWTDVPPTYRVLSSYVRHVPPTYKEVMEESVEYNVDGEDELWWRNNKDFGPESEVTIIWKAVDADNTAVFGVRSTKAKSAVSHDTEISDTNNDAEAEEENSGSEKGDERKGSSSKSNNININVNISSSNNNNDANKTYNKSSNYPKLTRMPKIPKNPTLQQTLLLNPYYLRSVQSTHSLLQKYRPRLPLHIMEQMIEVLEKATCFETIVTEEEAKGILIQKIPQLVDIFGEVDNNNVELDGEERIHSGNEGISVEGESDFTGNSSGSGGGGLGANATADSSIISNINTNKKLTSKNFKQQDRNSGRFISRKNSTTGTKSNIYSNTINNVNAKQDSTTKPKKVEWKELPNSTSNEKGAEPKSSKKRRRKDRDKKEPSLADVGKADASKPAADSSVNENENDTNAHHRESPIVPSLEDNESPPPSDPSTEETNQMQKDKPQTLLPFIAPPTTLSNVIHQIYTYWVNKRSKLRKPLLRRYWPVTSTNDVNPHMVFRPRDKVKRKLRKKRQNDYEAYKKMVQLKVDFERLRVLTDLVLKRERVFETMVELSNEYFEERLYQWLDTSGMPRQSGFLNTQKIESAIMDIPKYFDDGPILSGRAKGGKKRKRTSAAGAAPNTAVSAAAAGGLGATMEHERRDSTPNHPLAATDGVSSVAAHLLGPPAPHSNQPAAAKASPQPRNVLVAGFDGGYPAPSFLHPLSTRESHYVTSWENAVPFIPCYQDGMAIPTDRFRHRPRLGRGGRIIIDRFPCPSSSRPDRDDPPPPKVITYGSGMKRFGYHTGILGADGPDYNPNSTRSERSGHHDDSPDNYKNNAATAPRAPPAYQPQDLMPKSLGDPKILSRRIEEICAMGIMEDYQAARADSNINAGVVGAILEEDQGVDEVLVPIEDWMEAPEGEIYGKERFVIGPL